FSNQKVASSIPCRSVLEQDTEPLIAPDVQCAISVNVKCVYIVSRTYVSRFCDGPANPAHGQMGILVLSFSAQVRVIGWRIKGLGFQHGGLSLLLEIGRA